MSGFNSPLALFGGIMRPIKPLRILILGQSSVGKSAMVVRFITRRYIGEYDSSERVYTFSTTIDKEIVNFEILDSSGQLENDGLTAALETNIRWAEAFVIMYSVTDRCSFEDAVRFKFLINYNKRRRKIYKEDYMENVPVILVGNKSDLSNLDRMVSEAEGVKRSLDIGCACFHEISVRESIEQVQEVFQDACRSWRIISKFPKLKRSKSDSMRLSLTLHSDVEPDKIITRLNQLCYDLQDEKRRSVMLFGRSRSAWNEDEETDEFDIEATSTEPFRSRAKTDGNLLISRKKKLRLPSPISPPILESPLIQRNRRNSMSMRGHVSSY